MFVDVCNIGIMNVADSRNCSTALSENLRGRI